VKKRLLVGLVSGVLIGCGGGDDDNGSGGSDRDPLPTTESMTKIMSNLAARDFSYSTEHLDPAYPFNDGDYVEGTGLENRWASRNDEFWCGGVTACVGDNNFPPQNGTLRRFNPTPSEPIQVFINNPENTPDYDATSDIYAGLKLIEDAIGYDFPIFNYAEGGKLEQVNIPLYDENGDKEFYPDYSSVPYKGGIIFSVGTYSDPSQTGVCGSVFHSPWGGTGSAVIHINEFRKDVGWLWVALPPAGHNCGTSPELVAHELTHAFGIHNHFVGFGGQQANGNSSAAFGHQAKEALRILYSHETGSDMDNLDIPNY
jgi:hypothetical protein